MPSRIQRLLRRQRRRRRTSGVGRAVSQPDLSKADGGDWGATLRTGTEPHGLSLEGLNLEVESDSEVESVASESPDSRQRLLEEVLQTKELLQSKQKNRNCGGWTHTTADVLNSADRAELQVQMEAYREQLVLRQRKMSAALKAQSLQLPAANTPSDVSRELIGSRRQQLERRLHSLDTCIQRSERHALQTVTQIRQRRHHQLRTIQDLGAAPPTMEGEACLGDGLDSPCTSRPGAATARAGTARSLYSPSGAATAREGTAAQRPPRSLYSPSVVVRRAPLRFISALSRNKRRSAADSEEPAVDGPAQLTQPARPRSQVSAEALSEIARFERLVEAFLESRRVATVQPRPHTDVAETTQPRLHTDVAETVQP